MHIFRPFGKMILTLFAAYEFPTLFGLILIEEMGLPLPVPGDLLIAYAGGRAGHTPLHSVAVIGTVAMAATIGSSLLYLFSRHSGPAVIAKLHRILRLHPDRIVRAQRWFRRHGPVAIVLGRLIPGLRTPTSVMAGLSGVPFRVFIPSTALAATIWSAFYYYAGTSLHRFWAPFARWAGEDPEELVGIVVVAILLLVVWRWLRQRHVIPATEREIESARISH